MLISYTISCISMANKQNHLPDFMNSVALLLKYEYFLKLCLKSRNFKDSL